MTAHTAGAVANPRLWGKAGGRSWAAQRDAKAQAARARTAWLQKVMDQARTIEEALNPSPTDQDVQGRYQRLLDAHFSRMAAKSVDARRAKAAANK
jgi:hypothetical protein